MKMLTLPKGSPDPLPELAAFLAARRGDRLPRQLPQLQYVLNADAE